jgi:hypothetical protein
MIIRRCSNKLGKRSIGLGLLLTSVLLALGTVFGPSLLLAQPGPASLLDPLTPDEQQQARSVLLGDARARAHVNAGQKTRIVRTERHELGKGRLGPAVRSADVVMYDYTTNETVSAVVSLGNTPRVEQLATTTNRPPALSAEEVSEAKQLALASPAVQSKLAAAGLAGREGELMITHMLGVTRNVADPCSRHRCVQLFLNTANAVLDFQPVVDLTDMTVDVS